MRYHRACPTSDKSDSLKSVRDQALERDCVSIVSMRSGLANLSRREKMISKNLYWILRREFQDIVTNKIQCNISMKEKKVDKLFSYKVFLQVSHQRLRTN